ncbi:MAG: IS30 family transposase [Oscillospiraceae bacterium]
MSQRPEIAALRIEEGHWEGDTVVGKRGGKEAVVLSLLEKKTENYIAIRIPGKDADSVLNAMQSLRGEFGDKFSQVFKTITVDNGSEFSAFSQVENWGCAVLLCASLHLMGTSPKRTPQRAVSNLCSEGRVH